VTTLNNDEYTPQSGFESTMSACRTKHTVTFFGCLDTWIVFFGVVQNKILYIVLTAIIFLQIRPKHKKRIYEVTTCCIPAETDIQLWSKRQGEFARKYDNVVSVTCYLSSDL
jgi:hypothetical protein